MPHLYYTIHHNQVLVLFIISMPRMTRILDFTASKDEILTYPTPQSPSSSLRISPAILLTIVILAAVFFVTGLIHLLIRFFTNRPSSTYANAESSGASRALQRQLHQLFRFHDSGLDQTAIDALPVFYYKHIIGLKEPSDCAVCLCEFSDQDKLRLLPSCSHAFHIQCIDMWLLSNSSCPLCRGSLVRQMVDEEELDSAPSSPKSELDFAVVNRVFSVRLGKFRSFNEEQEVIRDDEGSCRYLDSRRCYSMGSYQYIVGDLDLQVAFPCRARQQQSRVFSAEEGKDEEGGKRINGRWSRSGDSFSISKIWLWPTNSRSNMPLPRHNVPTMQNDLN